MYCLLGNTDLSLQYVCKNTDIVPFEKERLDGGVVGLGFLKLNRKMQWRSRTDKRGKGGGAQLDQKYNLTISPWKKASPFIQCAHNPNYS